MFKDVFPMKKSKTVNFNEYPLRVIEIDRRSSFRAERVVGGSDKSRMSFASDIEDIDNSDFIDDYNCGLHNDNQIIEDVEFESGSIWPDYSDEEVEDVITHQEAEQEPYLQQFDQIDFNGTDWNNYDLNRIVF